MFNKMTAFILSATLALTSLSAAPAMAENGERARLLAGLAALAIIGSAINDANNNNNHAPALDRSKPQPQPHVQRPRNVLPRVCLGNYNTPDGNQYWMRARCLENKFRGAHRLPRDCKRQVWTVQGREKMYSPSCLKNRGFRIARH